MAVLIATFEVADFDRYWALHEAQLELRRSHGCTGSKVLRNVQDPTIVTVIMEYPTPEDAQRYLAIALAENAVRRASIVDSPRIGIYEEAGRTA